METLVIYTDEVTSASFKDVSDWLTCLDTSYTRLKGAGWDFILTLRAGVDQFGKTDHRKAELYELAASQLNLSTKTLQNYTSLARSTIATIAIELDLEFGFAHAAMGLDEGVARDLLTTAAEQGWEPARVRKEAWMHKNAFPNIGKSNCEGGGATNIADNEAPFNHQTRWDVPADQRTAVDEYEQQDDVTYPEKPERFYPLTAANHAVSLDPDYDGDEWYTPAEYIEAARNILGEIDLDPASCEAANQNVKAKQFYSKEDDALRDDLAWRGRVWLNPPYSMPLIKQFVAKLIDQYEAGSVTEAIILTNNSSDTGWFHDLLSRYPACFTRGRVQFWRPDSSTFGARQGQTLFYLGDDFEAFRFVFSPFGQVVVKA